MIYEALRTRLIATANVQSIVSSRIYPVKMPDNPTFPAISMQMVSALHEESLSGSSGLVGALLQLDCWAASINTAHDLAEKVRLALEGFRGTVASHDIQGITDWQTIDSFDDDTAIYRVSCLSRVWHIEAQPS